MPSPCEYDALWMKAKAQINRSFDALDDGDFEQAALWAACSLELLAKAALARVSPLLIADPVDDGASLLIAAGLVSDAARFRSIPAKALFSRCGRAFRGFKKEEAERIAIQRNEELHSGVAPFFDVKQDEWWERYWSLAVILVHSQDQTLEDLLGTDREQKVEEHLERNAENVARRATAMIERAARRWQAAAGSEDARRDIANMTRRPMESLYSEQVRCPACEQPGRLLGDDVLESDLNYSDEGEAFETVSVEADAFECESCGLRLHGFDFVTAAGLPQSLEDEREYEPVWDEYGND